MYSPENDRIAVATDPTLGVVHVMQPFLEAMAGISISSGVKTTKAMAAINWAAEHDVPRSLWPVVEAAYARKARSSPPPDLASPSSPMT